MNESIIARLPKSLVPIPTGLEPVGQLEIPVKAVLFDIYGTLFISESGDISIAEEKSRISAGLNDLLLKNHIDTPSETILKTFFNTIRATHKRLRAIGVDHPEVEIDLIWSEVLGINNRQSVREYAVEFELLANPVYPMPHLKEILVHCKDSGIPMGIISNAQFYTPLLFNWYLGSDPEDLGFFTDLIIYSYQTGHAKPSMVLFDIAVKRLRKYNINPRSVVYVGNDMLNDVYPADRVGFQTALFAGDDRSLRLRDNDPRCSDISANLVITDLIQLIEYIG